MQTGFHLPGAILGLSPKQPTDTFHIRCTATAQFASLVERIERLASGISVSGLARQLRPSSVLPLFA